MHHFLPDRSGSGFNEKYKSGKYIKNASDNMIPELGGGSESLSNVLYKYVYKL